MYARACDGLTLLCLLIVPRGRKYGSCEGHNNASNSTVYDRERAIFLREFAEKQMVRRDGPFTHQL